MGIALNGTSDGLDIAPGPGQGEAYIAPLSSWDPIKFQQHNMDMAMLRHRQQRAEEDKNRSRIDKWMNEKQPVTKWDIDQQRYFQQRLKEHEDKRIKLISEYKYNVPPEKMAELDREMEAINQEANISNEQFNEYNKTITEGIKKKEDGQPYYDAASLHGVQYYGHPEDFEKEPMVNSRGQTTTVGEELKRSGYDPKASYAEKQAAIFRFRANNKNLLQLEPDWHFIQREGKLLQEDKIEPNSQIVTGSYNGRKGTQTKIGYTEDQINGLGVRLYTENPKKFTQQIHETVLNQLGPEDYDRWAKKSLTEAGILVPQKDPKADPIYTPQFQEKVARDPKGAKDIIDEALAVKGHEIWFKKTHPDEVKGFNEFNKGPAGEKKKTFEDRYTVSVVPLEEITTKQGLQFPEQSSPNEPWYKTLTKKKSDTTPYVSIEPIGGKADTESLQLTINGKQVRPIGYKVKDGKVYMRAAESVPVTTGRTQFNYSTGQTEPIISYTYKVTDDIPVENEVAGNVSAHYGFKTFDAFKGMLEKEAGQAGVKPTKGKFKASAKEQEKETPAERAARIAKGG